MYFINSIKCNHTVLFDNVTKQYIEIDTRLLPDNIGLHFPLNFHIKKDIGDMPFKRFASILIPYPLNEERYAAFVSGDILEIDARLLPPDIQLPCILHIAVDNQALISYCLNFLERLGALLEEKVIDYFEEGVAVISCNDESIPLDKRILPENAMEGDVIEIKLRDSMQGKQNGVTQYRCCQIICHDTETTCQTPENEIVMIDKRLLPQKVCAGRYICVSVNKEETAARKDAVAALLKSFERKE